jgi:hypothetical protein
MSPDGRAVRQPALEVGDVERTARTPVLEAA